jgi:hypothetical protein
MEGFVLLDPVTALLQHVLLDIQSLVLIDLILKILLGIFKGIPELLLFHLAIIHSLVLLLDWIVLQFLLGLRLASHTQEHHFFLAHFLNSLTS